MEPSYPINYHKEAAEWFELVDQDNSGEINWQELQSALVNVKGDSFSESACKLMISMFDLDRTNTINIAEFTQLYSYINQWLSVFNYYDKDQSGLIDERELSHAFYQMGYRFTPDFIKMVTMKNKNAGKVTLDEFIVSCILIQHFSEEFRKRDKDAKGVITLSYVDFLQLLL